MGKKQKYSPEFKLTVIQAVKKGQFSAESASLHFGIANSGSISQWLQAFEKQSINGLNVRKASAIYRRLRTCLVVKLLPMI
ncbi:transposase and inactivated derivative [Actinobacillus ureae]|nr:transposase and inactivated derivative [Actinobacillus ureae]SUU44470.1 transposase and inactivated derivative [Actinobacillus ureae]